MPHAVRQALATALLSAASLLAWSPAVLGADAPPIEAGKSEEAGPTFVLVDPAVWVRSEPSATSRGWRTTTVAVAPQHRPVPAVLLREIDRRDGWVRVATVTMPAWPDTKGLPPWPDDVPAFWDHCYPAPQVIGQLGANGWVREADLMPVLAREVTVDAADGSRVTLRPGLALQGGGGVYRALGHHIAVAAAIPDDAVATSYTATGAAGRLEGETPDGEVTALHPQFKARVKVADDALTVQSPNLPPAEFASDGHAILRDRCLEVRFAAPVAGLPEPPTGLRVGAFPLYVAPGTQLTWGDGQPLGVVRSGTMPLWSRAGCTETPDGLCCDKLAGLEPSAHGVCIDIAIDQVLHRSDLQDLVSAPAEAASARLAELSGTPTVTVGAARVRGSITPADIAQAIGEVEDVLRYCYEQALYVEPTLEGEVVAVIGLLANGRAQSARISWGGKSEELVARCAERALEKLQVLNQIGFPPSVVELPLRFSLTPTEP